MADSTHPQSNVVRTAETCWILRCETPYVKRSRMYYKRRYVMSIEQSSQNPLDATVFTTYDAAETTMLHLRACGRLGDDELIDVVLLGSEMATTLQKSKKK